MAKSGKNARFRDDTHISRRRAVQVGTVAVAAAAIGVGGRAVQGKELTFPRMQATPGASPSASPATDLPAWEPRFTDTVTLRRFGFGTDNITSEVRAAAFQEAYPNFTLEVTPEITDQKILTAVASGDVPDLFWIGSDGTQSWAARDALEPLDDLMANDDRFDFDQFYDSEKAKVQYDGQTWGIPQFVDCRPMWLNQGPLDEAGVAIADVDASDWDRMRELGKQLLQANGDQISRWGFDTKAADFFWMWSWGAGGNLLSDDGRSASFDMAENIEALQYVVDVTNDQGGYSAYQAFIQTTGFDGADNFFVKDQVAMTPFENWLLGIVAQGDPEHQFAVVPFKGRNGNTYSITGGQTWAIPKGAKNKEAAWEWISYFSSPTIWRDTSMTIRQRRADEGSVYTPALTASATVNPILSQEVFQGTGHAPFDDAVALFPELLDANTQAAASPVLKEINDIIMNNVVKPALNGEMSPEDALKDGQNRAQQALDDFFS